MHCVEYSKKMIEYAKPFLEKNNITIATGDCNQLSEVPDNEYDFVCQIGVTSIFDDFRPSFMEMIRIAKPGAKCLNHMLVNEMPVDVIIKYINPKTKNIESGWNKHSIKTIDDFLRNNQRVKNIQFIKHVMPFDIPERENDKMRSWTRINEKGDRILWNGLNMEISSYSIIFEIK